MKQEIVLCPRCAAVYRAGYQLRESDSGAAGKRECAQCSMKGYFPRYELTKKGAGT